MVLGIAAASINKLFYKVLSAASNWPRELRREGRMTVDSPGPVTLEISVPQQRILTIPARLNSLPATAAETIWVLAGRDDMNFLHFYLKRALDFSDDGKTWRAAYGPRIRLWPEQTAYLHPKNICSDWRGHYHDQLEAVIEELRSRPSSRRAVIGLLNPVTDHDNFTAKDYPCTQYLHFIPRSGRLDLDIHIRSNDILWGLTGVNIFEFTVLQELVAYMVNIPIGKYYHIADSLHYYTDYQKRMDNILQSPHFDIYDHVKSHTSFQNPKLKDLDAMDGVLKEFMDLEKFLREAYNGFKNNMQEALEMIRRLPMPLPDICRCMLIYLTMRYWRYDPVMCRVLIRSILLEIEDPAVNIGMIEWLTRQKSLSRDFTHNLIKDIPEYLRAKIGNFIKENG